MESALIVSATEKSAVFFIKILNEASYGYVAALQSCGEARRLLLTRDFNLVVINAPLRDESGESLSRQIVSKSNSQVILVVKNEYYDAVSSACEDDGVLVVAKPLNKAMFWSALKLAKAAQSRLLRIRDENSELKRKIEDIRIVDRAKCVLISHLGISEQEAHRSIEKQAMDTRTSKRAVAEGILVKYEN